MEASVTIRPVAATFGKVPAILHLNPEFRDGGDVLKLALEIRFSGGDPYEALQALHHRLEAVCPSLSAHQCRGGHDFRKYPDPGSGESGRTEPGLALAHLIEHVMIDTIAYLGRAETVSGITGARKEDSSRYDVFVESPDRRAGVVAAHLAVGWVRSLLSGEDLDGRARLTLDLARHLYRIWPDAASLSSVTRNLRQEPSKVRQAFRWLVADGLACGVRQTMNFSNEPHLALCGSAALCPN